MAGTVERAGLKASIKAKAAAHKAEKKGNYIFFTILKAFFFSNLVSKYVMTFKFCLFLKNWAKFEPDCTIVIFILKKIF